MVQWSSGSSTDTRRTDHDLCSWDLHGLVFSLGQRETAFPSLSSSTCSSSGNRQYQLATSCCHILCQGRLHQLQHQWMSVRKQLVTRCPSFTYTSLCQCPPFPPFFHGMFVTVSSWNLADSNWSRYDVMTSPAPCLGLVTPRERSAVAPMPWWLRKPVSVPLSMGKEFKGWYLFDPF